MLEDIDKTKFLYSGVGPLFPEYVMILEYISKNPKKNAKEIAKALKKTKVYSELGLLTNFGFILKEGYPYKFEITPKGLNSLGE